MKGGDGAHLEEGLRKTGLSRLTSYILGLRPTQYCTRLYEHPINDALRRHLGEQIQEPSLLLLLPAGIRRVAETALAARKT